MDHDHAAAVRRAQALERELLAIRLRIDAAVRDYALHDGVTEPDATRRAAREAPGRRWGLRRVALILASLAPLGLAVAWISLREPEILRYPVLLDPAPAAAALDVHREPAPPPPARRSAAPDTGPYEGTIGDRLREMAKADYRAGLRSFAASHEEAALTLFRRAIETDATFPDPHRALGTILARKGDLEGMCAEFSHYVRLSPHAGDTAKIRKEMSKYAETVIGCAGGR